MAHKDITISMDENLLDDFSDFCLEVGMDISTAFSIFSKRVVTERKIPFEITAPVDPFYSEENMARLRKSIAQMEATGGTIHEVDLG